MLRVELISPHSAISEVFCYRFCGRRILRILHTQNISRPSELIPVNDYQTTRGNKATYTSTLDGDTFRRYHF